MLLRAKGMYLAWKTQGNKKTEGKNWWGPCDCLLK